MHGGRANMTYVWQRMVTENPMSRRKVSTTVYITPEQDQLLKQLTTHTKVPAAEYIRQGIDLVLQRERRNLPGQQLQLDVDRD